MAAAAHNRRTGSANGNGGSKWITKTRRLALYLRDRFTCVYCGTDLRDASRWEVTLDHLDTRAEGERRRARGLDMHPSHRLVTACRTCNCSRQDKPWREFATGGAIERIERTTRRTLNMDLARALLRGEAGDPTLEAR